jgi:predicted PolB exonuclease-like 3'-5' exonuclease
MSKIIEYIDLLKKYGIDSTEVKSFYETNKNDEILKLRIETINKIYTMSSLS